MKMQSESIEAVAAATVKSAPPVTVSAAVLAGVPMQTWVLGLTIVWLICQITGWVYDRFFRRHKYENQSD